KPVAASLQTGCTATTSCANCNSGAFQIMCVCTSGGNRTCTSCSPPGTGCTGCMKCCANVSYVENGVPVTKCTCSGSKCAGTCTELELQCNKPPGPYKRVNIAKSSFNSTPGNGAIFAMALYSQRGLSKQDIPVEFAPLSDANIEISDVDLKMGRDGFE